MSAPGVRLFSALWPDVDTAATLARCRDAWRWSRAARPQATQRLHLTLHFIGQVDRGDLPSFVRRLETVGCSAATIHLDQVELWSNGVAAICPRSLPGPIEALHEQVGRAITETGWAVDARAFRPHVTLARQANGSVAPPDPEVVRWPIDHHVLVESNAASGEYRVVWRSATTGD